MANCCDNSLSISGPEAVMEAFFEWLGDGRGVFSRITPLPDGLPFSVPEDSPEAASNTRTYGFADGYHFCNALWGTRREVDWIEDATYRIYRTATSFGVMFESAWTPPLPALEKLATELFPALRMSLLYNEEGMGFSGTRLWVAGELVEQTHNDFSISPCDICGKNKQHVTDYQNSAAAGCCTDCLPSYPELLAPAEVLVCCDNPAVLNSVFTRLSKYRIVSQMTERSAVQVLQDTFGVLHAEECGWSYPPTDHITDQQVAGSPVEHLPASVAWTTGGSVLISYTAPKGPQHRLWAELSRRYPQATWYVTGWDAHSETGATTVLSRGQTFAHQH